MCKYSEIEDIKLSNGHTIKDVNYSVKKEIEGIYRDCWSKGISVPFWDESGNTYLANPDGSEDMVRLDRETRKYSVIRRIAQTGQGRYAFLNKIA